MDRILANITSTVSLTIRDKDGNAVDADGQVTVEIKDSDGAVALASAVATKPASTTGKYQVTVTDDNVAAKMDVYDAIWTAQISGEDVQFITQFEVVGTFLFGIAELRNAFSDVADTNKYPTQKIVDAREQAEERIAEICGVAFTRRGQRDTLDGSGSSDLLVSRLFPLKVYTAEIGGTALTQTQRDDLKLYPYGMIRRGTGSWTAGDRNVEIHYEHGFKTVPVPIKRAAMLLARYILVPYNVPDRATSLSTDEGTFSLATPGVGGSMTGIPEVDAICREFLHDVPVTR